MISKRKLLSGIAALAAFACGREAVEESVCGPEERELTVTMVEAPAPETAKTYLQENTVYWGNGEYMRLWYHDGGDKFAVSEAASADASQGSQLARFRFSISPAAAENYTVGGIYPASAVEAINGIPNTRAAQMRICLPAEQQASAGRYDPAAYIMTVQPQTLSAIPAEITLSYRKSSALNHLVLTGVKEKVLSVSFSVPGADIAGGRLLDMTTDSFLPCYEGRDAITVRYDVPLEAGQVDVWFPSWEYAVAAGKTLTITVTGQNNRYVRTLTASSGGINARRGFLSKLAVDFSTVAAEPLSMRDFARAFVSVLDTWDAHIGTVKVTGGSTFSNVNVVSADFSFRLGAVTYDKGSALDVAAQGLEAMAAGASLEMAVPASRGYAWSANPYNEEKGNGGAFGNDYVSLDFMLNYINRQAAFAATNSNIWANFTTYTDADGVESTKGTPQVSGFKGVACLERGLLILARIYKYLLDNNISENIASALANVWFPADLYGSKVAERIPHSQFHGTTAASLAASRNAGVLKFLLKGSATLSSVHVRSTDAALADGGMKFVNLNCTKSAVKLDKSTATECRLFLKPGTYNLAVSICDSGHQAMTFNLNNCRIAPGCETAVSKTYSVDSGLLFYEGFDNFVWGGDYVGGSGAPGFSPDATAITVTSRTDATGYEEAGTAVAYNVPGTGLIQSNTWADVSGAASVSASHQLSASYVKSRNIGDYVYLFRCQERPGYLELGCANSGRGVLRLPLLVKNTTLSNVTISFDICPKYGISDDILLNLINGGYLTGAKVGGTAVTLTADNHYYRSNIANQVVDRNILTLPASAAAAKSWTHVELTATNVTDGSLFQIEGASSASGNHGMYIDNIKVVKTSEVPHKTLRLLYWNIQNGMWADQGNSYSNFVAWVKKYDPDVCVWCEAKTNYQTNSTSSISGTPYLPDSWATLAKKYGHSYTAIGGYRDNFPQVVTSKTAITTVQKITTTNNSSKPIAHGAGHHRVTVGGRTIDIVTMHTWPQKYGFGVSGTSAQETSASKNEGDAYRKYEVDYVVGKTVNNSSYSSRKYWLMMGDFNSRSRVDNWYYNYETNSTLLDAQDVIINKTSLVDVIAKKYPGDFVSSTHGNARIDFVYASSAMYANIVNAAVIIDKWTTPVSTGLSNFWNPSDHRPILIDFSY
ncbi:MAG: hypothetical protein J5871_03060 [Bacteroidales bacterium]|nr:hypothetical protein [Bacteroidales bacterium]